MIKSSLTLLPMGGYAFTYVCLSTGGTPQYCPGPLGGTTCPGLGWEKEEGYPKTRPRGTTLDRTEGTPPMKGRFTGQGVTPSLDRIKGRTGVLPLDRTEGYPKRETGTTQGIPPPPRVDRLHHRWYTSSGHAEGLFKHCIRNWFGHHLLK